MLQEKKLWKVDGNLFKQYLKAVKQQVTNKNSFKFFNLKINTVYIYTFIYTSWTLQYVAERVLFSRLLEGLIGGPCI